jgi:hypothetical protein
MLVPECASHTRIVPSDEPDTIFFPSQENATDITRLVWPFNRGSQRTSVELFNVGGAWNVVLANWEMCDPCEVNMAAFI